MSNKRVAVIMAGGSGERFWPLSREDRPKQLLKLTDPYESMLAHAINRIKALVGPHQVFVATGKALQQPIRKTNLLDHENVVAEPSKRNTLGCLCWFAARLLAQYGEESVTIAVLTADHLIGETLKFLS